MLFFDEKISPRDYNPLVLAYIGDSVYDLYVRTRVISKGNKHVTQMHNESVKYVKAHSQSVSMLEIEGLLTEEEIRIFKWGRNAKSNTTPKHADVTEYRTATGFETLIGYLYLNGEDERLKELLNISYTKIEESLQ